MRAWDLALHGGIPTRCFCPYGINQFLIYKKHKFESGNLKKIKVNDVSDCMWSVA